MTRARAAAMAGTMAVSILFAPGRARGDGDRNEALARTLFDEGRLEMGAGRYAEACPKFADSKKLDPGAGTMLNLAYCYEKMGRRAEAWAEYRAAALAAHDNGRVDWENAARARAERLEPRLVWMVVHAESPGDGAALALRLDGAPMPDDALARPMAVDPGHHELTAAAERHRPWSTTFDATEGHVSAIQIPALEALAAEPAGPASAPSPPPPPPTGPSNESPRRTAAWVLGGSGVAALGASAVLGLVANSTYKNADCAGNACTITGNDARSRAFVEAHVATAVAVAGAAALAGAAVLWLTAPSRATAIGIRPAARSAQLGVSVEATW